jgi:hypothetical protein
VVYLQNLFFDTSTMAKVYQKNQQRTTHFQILLQSESDEKNNSKIQLIQTASMPHECQAVPNLKVLPQSRIPSG